MRRFLERMGTLWIRAGQILALRRDVFSAEFCDELSDLRDTGTGIPFDEVTRVIQRELGMPLEYVFDEFQEHPFAATTISQVHMAHLRAEQIWVAVNVQHPDAQWKFQHDAALIRRLVRLGRRLGIHRTMRWNDLYLELEAIMVRELDYRYEATTLRRLKNNLRQHGVYVHEVFPKYTTRRLLVTEFIRAALMSDYVRLSRSSPKKLAKWLKTNRIDSHKLARRIFESVLRQIFEDNFFHADMHPSNIILLRNSQFSVLDSRNIGSLENETLLKHHMFFEALAEQNYDLAADIYLILASKLPMVEVSEVKSQLIRAFRTWETRTHVLELPFHEKSMTGLFQEINRITYRYKFQSQWSMAKLSTTWANLDESLECLWPEVNYLKQLRRYFRIAARRANRNAIRSTATGMGQNLFDARQLPKRMSENQLFRQSIMRRQAQVFQGSTDKIGYLFASVCAMASLFLLLAGAFLVTALVHQHFEVPVEGIIGTQLTRAASVVPDVDVWLWTIVLLFLSYLYWVMRRLTKTLQSRDVRVPEARAAI